MPTILTNILGTYSQDSHNVSMSHLCVEELTGQSVAAIFCLLIAFVLFFGYLLPQHLQAETELCSTLWLVVFVAVVVVVVANSSSLFTHTLSH